MNEQHQSRFLYSTFRRVIFNFMIDTAARLEHIGKQSGVAGADRLAH